MRYEREETMSSETKVVIWFIILLIAGVSLLFFGYPVYKVWYASKMGQSELAQAEYNRQIQTLEAKAKQESAKSLAEAEIIRAEGVAKANKIIGESLKHNEGYLQYLWIQSLQEGQNDVIYIPTEANIPIMEASRFNGRNTTATPESAQ